ncbi:MAG: ABC transporter permease [Gemmatimonadota bacterium]
MGWLPDRYQALRELLRRGNVEPAVREEFEHHLTLRTQENIARGMTPEAARAEALIRFGEVERYRRETAALDRSDARTASRRERWRDLSSEARRSIRGLVRAPAFSLTALVTLALGIGTTTAIFTLLDRIVLRPLPYPAAGRLVAVDHPVPGLEAGARWKLSVAGYFYFKSHSTTLEELGTFQLDGATLSGSGPAELISICSATASFLTIVGARTIRGRLFSEADDRPGAPPVVMLSHAFWLRRFGGDASVLGRTLRLDGAPVTVIGVMAAGIEPPRFALDVWIPIRLDPTARAENHHQYTGLGRLKPGVTPRQATAELAGLTARFTDLFPTAYSARFMERYGFTEAVTPLRDSLVSEVAGVLWILFGSVAVVLLIAGANVGNLFLIRAETRRRDVSIRSALGAGRRELVAVFLTESMALCGAAAVAGVGLGWAATRALAARVPQGFPRGSEIAADGRTTAFGVGLGLIAGLVFGLLPVLRKAGGSSLLGDGGHRLTVSRRGHLIRRALVAGQVALSVVLLASAGLMLQSYWRLRHVSAGFDPSSTLSFTVVLPSGRYDTQLSVNRFHTELARRLGALPGVVSSAAGSALPLEGMAPGACGGVAIEGRAREPGERAPCVPVVQVTAGFFRTLGIPVEGRAFTDQENDAGAKVAVVSRAFARRFWGTASPIGRRVTAGNEKGYSTVVGVAGDVRGYGLDQPPVDAVYFPLVENQGMGIARGPKVVVRTGTVPPSPLVRAIRGVLSEVDPDVPLADVRTMDEIVDQSLIRTSITMFLLVASALMALGLSALSVYGAFAYLVAERRHEIAVRMALGAETRRVTREIVTQSLQIAGIGVAVGLVAAVGATRVLQSLLFEVQATDPAALGAAVATLLAVSLMASYGPARRAARVDPMAALRE